MNDYKTRIEEFLQSVNNGKVSKAYYANIERFFKNQLYSYYEATGKRVEDFTVDDMADFMSTSKLTLKMRTFENNCVYVRKYMRWCEAQGYISEEQMSAHFSFIPGVISSIFNEGTYAEKVATRKYFISTKEFVEFINTIFGEELSEKEDGIRDVSRFDSQTAILYLLWMGFSAEQIEQLHKDDFDAKSKTICGIKITDADIYSFFIYYKPRTDLMQLRKKGEPYQVIYQDTEHLVKGIHNPCNKIIVRNATITAQKRQKMLPENHKFRHISVNVSTIFYSQLFEKCYQTESELATSSILLSKKTLESYVRDIIKTSKPNMNDVAISKALKEYTVYKVLRNSEK